MASTSRILLGAQSYSFRSFSFEDSIKCLKELGLECIEYCAVHFPPDTGHEGFAKVKETVVAEGVRVVSYGVEGFSDDAAANRRKFEFAKALGIKVLTADPTPEAFDNLDKLTEEFGIAIAIHNHGPGARYDKVEDTLRAVEEHSPMIGACLDTGHAIRSKENPVDAIEQLGERLISLHLKDWRRGGEEQILGHGDLDLLGTARALKGLGFSGVIVMEYENSPEDPIPEMKAGFDNWINAWDIA